ncbi:hypothetical protein H6F89_32270 [Cyanobacteria bacterium FACHB-63]|nr:hypothetical protein [Cyanobacteria bacterium FACHB-63]
MKLLKIALVVIVFLVNLSIAQPSWADKPKVSKNADYIEITKEIETLTQEQETNGSTPEIKQQIDELKLQKAAISSGTTEVDPKAWTKDRGQISYSSRSQIHCYY